MFTEFVKSYFGAAAVSDEVKDGTELGKAIGRFENPESLRSSRRWFGGGCLVFFGGSGPARLGL